MLSFLAIETEDWPLSKTPDAPLLQPIIGQGDDRGERDTDLVLPSCGDFDMRIACDGTWFYRGSPIGRKALVKLFSTVLRREDDGSYWLVTPVERGRIQVDDAPFVAVELIVKTSGAGQEVTFRTNVDVEVPLDSQHGLRIEKDPENATPRPYLMLDNGLEALLLRAVFYHLVDLAVIEAVKGRDCLGVWSFGTFFVLEEMEEV